MMQQTVTTIRRIQSQHLANSSLVENYLIFLFFYQKTSRILGLVLFLLIFADERDKNVKQRLVSLWI